MKKVIMMILAIVMASIMLCGCEVHEISTVTTHGVDNMGNQYEIVSVYEDGILISQEER